MNDLGSLQSAIRQLHGCESSHVKSVDVTEAFQGAPIWHGTVEVFDLIGHPKAKRCYAWDFDQNGRTRYLAVLEIFPVDSAKRAVQVAIAAEARNNA
jgi:hypothetical protein